MERRGGFCRSNVIKKDELIRKIWYYAQSVREQAPTIIAKAKWEEAMAREYCKANGIAFDCMNPGQEVIDAVNDRKAELLEAHRGDIVYCVP